MSRVAVLLPVLDDPDGVQHALSSATSSQHCVEAVVVDDGSVPALEPGRLGNLLMPVHVLRHPHNQGITAALNTGLQYILDGSFEYVARVDAGDRMDPERIDRQVMYLEQNPTVGLVASDVMFCDIAGNPLYRYDPGLSHQEILREMYYRPSFIHSAVTLRVSVLRVVGLYRDDYPGGEDYDLFWRALDCASGANLPEILQTVFYDPQGITRTQRRHLIVSRLRLQWSRRTLRTPHSALGILRTLGLALMPHEFFFALKRVLRPPAPSA